MNFDILISKRATFYVALLFSVFCFGEQTESSLVKSYEQDIKSAQKLILQKKRKEALSLLKKSIFKNLDDKRVIQKIYQSVDTFSGIFFTDNAQKSFELAESIYFSAQTPASERYQEALKLEANNLVIQTSLIRALISAKLCDEATEMVQRAKKLDPFSEEIEFLNAKILICKGHFHNAKRVLKNDLKAKLTVKDISPTILKTTLAEVSYMLGEWKEAKNFVSRAIKADANYPEAYYWQWKLSKRSKSLPISVAQKYISICQNITPNVRRKYKNDPFLCNHKKELASYVKELKK